MSNQYTGKVKTRMNALTFTLAISELMEGPTTRAELSECTGLHWHTVQLLVRAMHEKGVIHIAGWERDSRGCASIAAFALGRKKDAPKPPPKTNAESMRAYKARKAQRDAMRASAGVCIQVGASA